MVLALLPLVVVQLLPLLLLALLLLLPPCPIIMRHWIRQKPCTGGGESLQQFWPRQRAPNGGWCYRKSGHWGILCSRCFSVPIRNFLFPLRQEIRVEHRKTWISARAWLSKACNLARSYDPETGVYAISGPGPPEAALGCALQIAHPPDNLGWIGQIPEGCGQKGAPSQHFV